MDFITYEVPKDHLKSTTCMIFTFFPRMKGAAAAQLAHAKIRGYAKEKYEYSSNVYVVFDPKHPICDSWPRQGKSSLFVSSHIFAPTAEIAELHG